MSVVKILETLSRQLDTNAHKLRELDAYYKGEQHLAFLSKEAKEALGNRLKALTVNYPRVVVDAMSERLRVVGFSVDGQSADTIYRAWEDAGFEDGHGIVHTEALALGRSYVLVWAGEDGAVTITAESPHEFATVRDPVSGKVSAAVKRWVEDERARAIVWTDEAAHEYVSGADVPAGGVIPPEGWEHAKTTPKSAAIWAR